MKKSGYSDVTVIIPTRNEEKTIAEVIQELKHPGYHNSLIVDGNSKDKTVQIAKEFEKVEIIFQRARADRCARPIEDLGLVLEHSSGRSFLHYLKQRKNLLLSQSKLSDPC